MTEIDYSLHYAKWHDGSDAHHVAMAHWYTRLLAPVLSGLPRDARILDVGCGAGLLVHALAIQGFGDVRGIDTSAQQIDAARRRGLRCEHVDDGYVQRLADAGEAVFDLICLMDVLEHVPVHEQMRFATALRQLLAPGGQLLISVPNASSAFAARWRYLDWTHRCLFTEASLEFVLCHAGFAGLRFLPFEYGVPPPFPWLHRASFWTRLLRRVVRGLRRLEAIGEMGRQGLTVPLSPNLLAVARRGTD